MIGLVWQIYYVSMGNLRATGWDARTTTTYDKNTLLADKAVTMKQEMLWHPLFCFVSKLTKRVLSR